MEAVGMDLTRSASKCPKAKLFHLGIIPRPPSSYLQAASLKVMFGDSGPYQPLSWLLSVHAMIEMSQDFTAHKGGLVHIVLTIKTCCIQQLKYVMISSVSPSRYTFGVKNAKYR